jgi:hypothetical protein
VRPYPRAIAGRIVAFNWEAEIVRFDLEVTEAGAEVSEIYLPSRHFGATPNVEVRGSVVVRLDSAEELLLVEAVPGSAYAVSVSNEAIRD